MAGLVFIMLAALVVSIIVKDLYDSTNHSSYLDAEKLCSDATIVNFQRKVVELKGQYRYRTVISFSDVFVYISHKADVDELFLAYRISVSRELDAEILADAIESHDKMNPAVDASQCISAGFVIPFLLMRYRTVLPFPQCISFRVYFR